MKKLLKGGKVYTGGAFVRVDVLVEDGVVAGVGDLSVSQAETVDVSGKHLLPGLVDVHVHFREPGFSYKETIATGSSAAARGGYTTVCTMPNLNPAPDTAEHLGVQLEMIRQGAVVKVVPYGTITMRQNGGGELSDMAAMRDEVVGFSDDGRGVQEDAVMEAAMREAARLGKPIVAHCEVNSLLHGGYIHDGEYARLHGHRGICSESEWKQVERDIELVRRTGCRYHVCHVSTRESVELVRRAKAEGLPVSCETAPHYLVLTDMDLREEGRFKMNPPIRSAEDRNTGRYHRGRCHRSCAPFRGREGQGACGQRIRYRRAGDRFPGALHASRAGRCSVARKTCGADERRPWQAVRPGRDNRSGRSGRHCRLRPRGAVPDRER